MKWLPNLMSLARVIIAPFIAILAINGQWKLAFILTLIGAATDFFDGMLATWLEARTKLGEEWIDPLADFALSIGVLVGVVFQNSQWHERAGIGIVLVISIIVLKFFKQQKSFIKIKNFAYGFLPLYYCILAVIFFYIYANKALTQDQMMIIKISLLPIVFTLGFLKRHRLKDWLDSLKLAF